MTFIGRRPHLVLVLGALGSACGSSSTLGDAPSATSPTEPPPVASGGDAAVRPTGPGGQCTSPLDSTKVSLPADDAVHVEEPNEWWYWTGHLKALDGRWFGFEQVFFRAKLGVAGHMVHSAVTDISGRRFFHFSRSSLGELPLTPFGFAFDADGHAAKGGNGHDMLHGAGDSYSFDLELTADKRPVLQHHIGYTDYPFGGYTYYYSRERMTAKGVLTIDGAMIPVTGMGWFDHQYGDIMPAVKAGWDWFSLQLDDGREIMLFVVRKGGQQVFVGASVTSPGCVTEEVPPAEVSVVSLGTWKSPHTACTYPAGWTLKVKGATFEVKPFLADQELYTATPIYWEGASSVTGSATGRAYVELSGYCPPPLAP